MLGLTVRALVRDEGKLPDSVRGQVEVHIGDVLNYEQVAEAVDGMDAVVVILGTRNDLSTTATYMKNYKRK